MISLHGFLVGLTQWLNATTGGDPDEPFSARAAREAESGRRRWIILEAFIDLAFALVTGERDHCRNTLEGQNDE